MADAVRHDPKVPAASRGGAEVVRAERLAKTFAVGGDDGVPVAAVRGVDLGVDRGEFVALTGPSGSGKSTLLHLLGGVTRPSAGRVLLEGVDLATLDDDALAVIRRRRIGFVFQRYNLVPELTLLENAALPLVLDGVDGRAADEAAFRMLDLVGIAARAGHRPDELSGGEQQRGAIARALVARPALVLADEPTGALDSDTSRVVIGLLQRIAADQGQTVVVVTHEPAVAAAASRTIRMQDGTITRGAAGALPRQAAR